MTGPKLISIVFLVLIALVTTPQVASLEETKPISRIDSLEKRLNELKALLIAYEKRLAKLEESIHQPLGIAKSSATAVKPPAANADTSASDLIEAKISNKRYEPKDIHSGIYSDYIWYDATYTSRLKKNTRSLKGVLIFCDLFGEPKFQLRVTLDNLIEPGRAITKAGVGFEYNQFLDSHKWMLATSLNNMIVKFKVESVLYVDGTREDF